MIFEPCPQHVGLDNTKLSRSWSSPIQCVHGERNESQILSILASLLDSFIDKRQELQTLLFINGLLRLPDIPALLNETEYSTGGDIGVELNGIDHGSSTCWALQKIE